MYGTQNYGSHAWKLARLALTLISARVWPACVRPICARMQHICLTSCGKIVGSYCVIGIILSFIALYNDACLHSRLRKGREKENSTASSPRASRLRSNSLRPGSTATQAIILESLFLSDSGRTIVSTDMALGWYAPVNLRAVIRTCRRRKDKKRDPGPRRSRSDWCRQRRLQCTLGYLPSAFYVSGWIFFFHCWLNNQGQMC